jgi:NAD(P)H-dependent FMN reductase
LNAAMSKLKVFAVAGSLNDKSVTRVVIGLTAAALEARGCEVYLADLAKERLELFDPDNSYTGEVYQSLKARVEAADVLVLGTPDYHGTIASPLKNFLDHFWKEFAGKLFATVVASYDKGLTVTDHLRTVARQCYAWSMPYAVAFSEKDDIKDGLVNEGFQKRLEMFVRDVAVYGAVLAEQRHRDLAGSDVGFLARHRK